MVHKGALALCVGGGRMVHKGALAVCVVGGGGGDGTQGSTSCARVHCICMYMYSVLYNGIHVCMVMIGPPPLAFSLEDS